MNRLLRAPLLLAAAALVPVVAAPVDAVTPQSPNDWLDRMSAVVNTMNFEGTVIRRRDGQSQALKVVHKVVDGVVSEKVITQEGNGLEIIRNGNEVHCILPDKKSVLVEFWNDDSTLFSTLPKSQLRFGSEYDLSIVREERVAGRNALLLAVRPHDDYRYGHRIWLDRETAFPLRTELFGGDGALLEQLKFADIRLNSEIPAEALLPSMSLDDYTWYAEPASPEIEDIESEWVCDDLPPGFRLLSETRELLPGSDVPVTHLMYGDGLASVSVFVAAPSDDGVAGRAAVGASNSFSVSLDQAVVTAIGDVPIATVRRIARGMRLR